MFQIGKSIGIVFIRVLQRKRNYVYLSIYTVTYITYIYSSLYIAMYIGTVGYVYKHGYILLVLCIDR